jgi:hypothetical protein
MARLNWSGSERDKDGLVRFEHPKTGKGCWALPTAIVFVDGVRIVGVDTTVEQRKR